MYFVAHVGHRIVGLDACYTDHNGKVALQAERCADVIIPKTPDPVLTSCGVVLLYQDPQSRLVIFFKCPGLFLPQLPEIHVCYGSFYVSCIWKGEWLYSGQL